jgi:cytosine/adenosine deaminase-related metal-dependent hydrolase/ubiquinone/menaquinone biosynthesis C-methylase UbiE
MTGLMETSAAALPATPSTFDLWATVYDTQSNPFLSLEQRVLSALLPDFRGLDVLDAGCGTGRLLRMLKASKPRRVVGVDSSAEMLMRAAQVEGAEILHGTCERLPLETDSIDCVCLSFVASYLPSVAAFADEVLRVARLGATVWITDLHPETASALKWKRSFRLNGDEMEIASSGWSIEDVREAFQARGFEVSVCIEPAFAAPEQHIFEQAGRGADFDAVRSRPAIYVLAFKRLDEAGPIDLRKEPALTVTGSRCAITAEDAVAVDFLVQRGRLTQLDSRADLSQDAQSFDLTGYLMLPGLVNAHDHLEFGPFPRLGHGPYQNAQEWGEDIHLRDPDMIALHRGVPREARAWWGAIRNLLAGVTTVCHHNPLSDEMRESAFPVRVVQNFRWAHSLAYDGELSNKARSGPQDCPFIFHAAEGIDEASAVEFARLEELGVIDERAVLIHGLALSSFEVARMNVAGAALVVCPSSNQFLFGRHHTGSLLGAVANAALGSDSPLTAAGDLLHEIRFARDAVGLDASSLYRMTTTAPASILHLCNGEGRLRPGGFADFIAVKDRGQSPAGMLVDLESRDVELVVREGRVFLVSDGLYCRLRLHGERTLEPIAVDGRHLWIRAPLAKLFGAAKPVMQGDSVVLAGKRVAYGHAA